MRNPGKPLAGAVFELRTEDGRVLETLKTGKKGRAVSKQYPVGVFESGVLKESTKLILEEVKAPAGYEKEEKEYQVVLLQKGEEGFSGEVVQKVTNHKKVTVSSNAPKTGDSTDFFAVSCIVCLSGEAMIMLFILKRRSARRRKR